MNDIPRLFIKSGCPWCREAIHWLDQKGFTYEKIDVLADPAAYNEMKTLSGQKLTPTMVWPDGKLVADFDTGELQMFLEKHDIQP